MGTCYRLALWTVVALLAVPAFAGAQNIESWGNQAPLSATITLGRSPEPPDCSQPESDVSIWWTITYSTTPREVIYTVRDPNGATVDSVYYAGATGVDINTTWHVPFAAVVGKYWVRVEYWSYEAAHEATAEVSFYVCSGIGRICIQKVADGDCNGELSVDDYAVQGWWVCIDTPWGDTFCDTTNANGIKCWENLPLGTYTVYELPVTGWTPILPPQTTADLTADNPQWAHAFLNQKYDDCFGACCLCNGDCVETTPGRCEEIGYMFNGMGTHCEDIVCGAPSAVEKTTWSAIKDSYR